MAERRRRPTEPRADERLAPVVRPRPRARPSARVAACRVPDRRHARARRRRRAAVRVRLPRAHAALASAARSSAAQQHVERLASDSTDMLQPGEQLQAAGRGRADRAPAVRRCVRPGEPPYVLVPDRRRRARPCRDRPPTTGPYARAVAAADCRRGARPARARARRPAFDVVVRDDDGRPGRDPQRAVARRRHADADPLLARATRRSRCGVARLEAAGGVRAAAAAVDPRPSRRAHARVRRRAGRGAARRLDGPRPHGGVGGTRTGVKCLHAHYAWHLAGGDDPVGAGSTEHLA